MLTPPKERVNSLAGYDPSRSGSRRSRSKITYSLIGYEWMLPLGLVRGKRHPERERQRAARSMERAPTSVSPSRNNVVDELIANRCRFGALQRYLDDGRVSSG